MWWVLGNVAWWTHPSPCQTTAKILLLGGLPWSRVLDWRSLQPGRWPHHGSSYNQQCSTSSAMRQAVPGYIVPIAGKVPVRYELNQSSAFPVTPNQSPTFLKRIVWSMESKAAERSSNVSAVTLPASIDARMSLWIFSRAGSVEVKLPICRLILIGCIWAVYMRWWWAVSGGCKGKRWQPVWATVSPTLWFTHVSDESTIWRTRRTPPPPKNLWQHN